MITFRPLHREDISNIIYWLRQEHVLDVWDSAQNASDDQLYDKYIARLSDNSIETYIIVIDEVDVGLIQTYIVENIDDFSVEKDKAMGCDLFIGDPNYINKGYGTRLLRQFVRDYIFIHPEIEIACIDPEVANERAIAAYQNVGFRPFRVSFDHHSELLTMYLKLHRSEFKFK